MDLDQNDNYFSSDFVNQDYEQNFNQGTVKGYTDFQDNMQTNTIMRKPMSTSYNYMNNLNNIPPNKTQIKNKDNSVRKCQTFRENSKNELKEGDNKINIEFKNTKIKKIVKEYKNIKKMMAMMPYYGDINCDKLRTFILSD